MSDDVERRVDDKSVETKRLAAFRQAVVEADEADVIVLSGLSRDEWLAEIDRVLADGSLHVEGAPDGTS